MIVRQLPESVLFITLDSCRYDTFVNSHTPHMDKVGELHRAIAPSYFTYASHCAMFVGFTPGVASENASFINPKWGKLFRMAQGGIKGPGREQFLLEGRSIIDGFNRLGYQTIGAGAVGWFNTATETGKELSKDFKRFYYSDVVWGLDRQLQWLESELCGPSAPVFVFLNIGETHVPYYYPGADWEPNDNPCVPFSDQNDRNKCVIRQKAALEYVDRQLGPLLEAFNRSSVILCADHGDCWGEDGLWEHGVHHEKTLEVPLLFHLNQ